MLGACDVFRACLINTQQSMNTVPFWVDSFDIKSRISNTKPRSLKTKKTFKD